MVLQHPVPRVAELYRPSRRVWAGELGRPAAGRAAAAASVCKFKLQPRQRGGVVLSGCRRLAGVGRAGISNGWLMGAFLNFSSEPCRKSSASIRQFSPQKEFRRWIVSRAELSCCHPRSRRPEKSHLSMINDGSYFVSYKHMMRICIFKLHNGLTGYM